MSPPLYLKPRLILIILMALCSNMVSPHSVVEYLPGFPGKLPFNLQTGYIGVGESEDLQLFYYFVESERSPENDPLIIWIQGGPGCSGFSGLAYIIGPIRFDYAKADTSIPTLLLNPYSWTKLSNIIFIDQPVGTGFTYPKSKSPQAYESNDTISGILVYEFLQKWIINHPKFQKNPLYIAGDSFGGIIAPLVVDHVYNGIKAGSDPHLNMKGYILGNPITDYSIDYNGRIPYAHRNGLLSDELYQSAKDKCNGNYVNVEPENHLCKNVMERVNQCVEKINIIHILEPWCDSLGGKRGLLSHQTVSEDENYARRFLQSSSTPKSWCRRLNYIFSYKWANKKVVQEALHIREGTITEWVRVNLTMRNGTYTQNVDSVVNYHKKFANQSNCRVLIYSGDQDMGVPHSTTEEWIRSLKLQIKSGWRPWFVEGQVAGYATVYSNRDSDFTYVTVKGAGHTAPEYLPKESFSMFDRWLSGSPL